MFILATGVYLYVSMNQKNKTKHNGVYRCANWAISAIPQKGLRFFYSR